MEADYTYVFNFFGDISYYSELPSYCGDDSAAAVQFGVGGQINSCHTLGRYDADYDDQIWSLLDKSSDADPSKGVSLKYLDGDPCAGGRWSGRKGALLASRISTPTPTPTPNPQPQTNPGVKRQLTLNVECFNHPYRLVSASESVFQRWAENSG